MKKLLALVLALCMIFALAACGEAKPQEAAKTDSADGTIKLDKTSASAKAKIEAAGGTVETQC